MKYSLKRLIFDLETWEDQASNRKEWCKTCFIKLKGFEDSRLKNRDQLCQVLNQKRDQNPALTNFVCRCGFIARCQAGLALYSKKHQ